MKSVSASAEEIVETSPEVQPDAQAEDETEIQPEVEPEVLPEGEPEVQPDIEPEAVEQVNEEVPLANEECSSVALNNATDEVAPPGSSHPSG